MGWTEQQYADVVAWFSIAYALGFLFVGRIMDHFGTRRGLAGSVIAWSLAGMSMALARTLSGFSAARFALGLAESGNFPASIKTVAEWFPARERAFATGIFNAGSNVNKPLIETTEKLFFKAWELACYAGFLVGREAARVMTAISQREYSRSIEPKVERAAASGWMVANVSLRKPRSIRSRIRCG